MTPIGLAPPPPGDTSSPEDSAAPAAEPGRGRPVLTRYSRKSRPRRQFVGPALWVSLGIHLLLVLAIWELLRFGPGEVAVAPPTGDTVTYLDLGAFPSGGGDGTGVPDGIPEGTPLPEVEAGGAVAPPSPVVAPPSPTGEPAAPARDPAAGAPGGGADAGVPQGVPGGAGDQAGGAGGAAGVFRPGFSDPRLYSDPKLERLRGPQISDAERYRRHFQARIDALNDSMYGAGARGPNTDWTVKDGSGGRWGVSEKGIHLGKITVPRAVIPIPQTGSAAEQMEEREQQRQRDEIRQQEEARERQKALEEARKKPGGG